MNPAAALVVDIPAGRITDWDSFHAVFDEAMGFPGFYGENMNAWIDCMRSLRHPEDGMTQVHVPPGGLLILRVLDAKDFRRRCPEQYRALVECTEFVNEGQAERGAPPLLELALSGFA